MKKVLLAVITGMLLSQSAQAGLARITTIELNGSCYETTNPWAQPIIAKASECDPKEARIQTKIVSSEVVNADSNRFTLYTVIDQGNAVFEANVTFQVKVLVASL